MRPRQRIESGKEGEESVSDITRQALDELLREVYICTGNG